MAQYFLATAASRALQAPAASSLQAAAAIATVAGYAVGDIIQITGCSRTPANRIWIITAIASGQMILVDLAGLSPTLVFSGNPSCTVNHIGFRTAVLSVDNTVMQSSSDFNLHFRVDGLSPSTGLRVNFEDSNDNFATDYRPGAMFSCFGAIHDLTTAALFGADRRTWPGFRGGNPNVATRASVWVEGALGAAAPAGASVTFSSWLETHAPF